MTDRRTYTVFCKMPEDERGEYSEEIDVVTLSRSPTRVKQIAQEMIDEFYDPELRPVKVVERIGSWL